MLPATHLSSVVVLVGARVTVSGEKEKKDRESETE